MAPEGGQKYLEKGLYGLLHCAHAFLSSTWNIFYCRVSFYTENQPPSPREIPSTIIDSHNERNKDGKDCRDKDNEGKKDNKDKDGNGKDNEGNEDTEGNDDNKTIYEENSWERRISIKKRTVVKRHVSKSELLQRPDGTAIYPYWAQERLRNEAATLALIAEKTTIPVPKCRLYVEGGVLHIETTRITNGIIMTDLDKDVKHTAIVAVETQMQNDILPQLRSLRRDYIGSVDADLPVFPPQRVYRFDRRSWERVTSNTDEFVLCHNDLSPQNILVDPDDNFRIVGIIDWEFSGFFPHYFEIPLWRSADKFAIQKHYEGAEERELGFFGLKPDDLKNCSADMPSLGWCAKI